MTLTPDQPRRPHHPALLSGFSAVAGRGLLVALVALCAVGSAWAHDGDPLEAMSLPELRQMGPVNPPNPANDGTYRDSRKTYCELGLLYGLHCTNCLQVHHGIVTDKALTRLGLFEMWKDPRNLFTACCLTDCPVCGQSCHFVWWHNKNFKATDGITSRALQYRLLLIQWVKGGSNSLLLVDGKIQTGDSK